MALVQTGQGLIWPLPAHNPPCRPGQPVSIIPTSAAHASLVIVSTLNTPPHTHLLSSPPHNHPSTPSSSLFTFSHPSTLRQHHPSCSHHLQSCCFRWVVIELLLHFLSLLSHSLSHTHSFFSFLSSSYVCSFHLCVNVCVCGFSICTDSSQWSESNTAIFLLLLLLLPWLLLSLSSFLLSLFLLIPSGVCIECTGIPFAEPLSTFMNVGFRPERQNPFGAKHSHLSARVRSKMDSHRPPVNGALPPKKSSHLFFLSFSPRLITQHSHVISCPCKAQAS